VTTKARVDGIRAATATRVPRPAQEYAWSVAIALVATGVCLLVQPWLAPENLIMVYLSGVTIAASKFRIGPSALVAGLSVACFDFFLIPPHLSFAVSDSQYLLTFAIMLAVALLISGLAQRLRGQLEASEAREQRATVLYGMSRTMAESHDEGEIAQIGADELGEVLNCPVAVELNSRVVCSSPGGLHLVGSGEQVSLMGGRGPFGTVFVGRKVDVQERALLNSLCNGLAVAIERAMLAREERAARVIAETEKTRNVLLNSVSHDLRTPLTVIAGAASALAEGVGDRLALAETILTQSERLNRHVQNLLDITRLEADHVRPQLGWHSIEELIGVAIRESDHVLGSRKVRTFIPAGLALVRIDAVLLQKALVNLLENAARHTRDGDEIDVRVSRPEAGLRIQVADRGCGITPGEEKRIFQKFYQPEGANSDRGFGLGLAICKAVAEAHAGTIKAENRVGGGALFILDICTPGEAPEVPCD
jgi:two-component system sensor histidine kinase KdpD